MNVTRRTGRLNLPVFGLLPLLAWWDSARAVTPPPDESPAVFAGEWAGTGKQGSYCYLNLDAGGGGWVLVDGGSGDWLGARIQWRNQRQSLQVEKITPLPSSPRYRVMPLQAFDLRSQFNLTLSLSWGSNSAGCQLQRIESSTRHLDSARSAIEALRQPGSAR